MTAIFHPAIFFVEGVGDNVDAVEPEEGIGDKVDAAEPEEGIGDNVDAAEPEEGVETEVGAAVEGLPELELNVVVESALVKVL
jgi:hypothetical protein